MKPKTNRLFASDYRDPINADFHKVYLEGFDECYIKMRRLLIKVSLASAVCGALLTYFIALANK